jgi:hypothetical protein
MNGTISILPSTYDVQYIVEKAGLYNHYGYEPHEDGIHLVYPIASYEEVISAIQSYEVDYLEIMLPKKLDEIDTKRKATLDTTTVANLTGAVVGLERHPDRPCINWQYGAGKFFAIPRDMMFAMADAAFAYMQSCFDHAKQLTERALAAQNITELGAVNVDAGWPGDETVPPVEPTEPVEPEPVDEDTDTGEVEPAPSDEPEPEVDPESEAA